MRGSRSGEGKRGRSGDGVEEANKWRTLGAAVAEVGGEEETRGQVGLQDSAPLCTKLPHG